MLLFFRPAAGCCALLRHGAAERVGSPAARSMPDRSTAAPRQLHGRLSRRRSPEWSVPNGISRTGSPEQDLPEWSLARCIAPRRSDAAGRCGGRAPLLRDGTLNPNPEPLTRNHEPGARNSNPRCCRTGFCMPPGSPTTPSSRRRTCTAWRPSRRAPLRGPPSADPSADPCGPLRGALRGP